MYDLDMHKIKPLFKSVRKRDLLAVPVPPPRPAPRCRRSPPVREGHLPANCIYLKRRQTCTNAGFVYAHGRSDGCCGTWRFAAPLDGDVTFAAVWEVARRTPDICCFIAVVALCKEIRCVRPVEAAGWLVARAKGWQEDGTRQGLQRDGGRDAQHRDSGVHTKSSHPKALLKQHYYFRDTYKGKFPISTVYEATGPQRRRNGSWNLSDAVDAPSRCSSRPLPTKPHRQQPFACTHGSPGSALNSLAFIHIQITG